MAHKDIQLTDPIIIVKILGEADGDDCWDPQLGSSVRCLICGFTSNLTGLSKETTERTTTITDGNSDRKITVANFRQNKPKIGSYYLAFKYDRGYILDNQAVFGEYYVAGF